MSEGGRNRRGEGPTVGDSLGEAGPRVKIGWSRARKRTTSRNARWEGENKCVEVETERRRGKEGVRTARCPVRMTGLRGRAEERRRVVFYCLWSTSAALPPDADRQEAPAGLLLSKERRMPPNYDSAEGRDSVPKKSHSKAPSSFGG